MAVNMLRRLLEQGILKQEDLQPNELAQLMGEPMPQPRMDIAPMQPNTMRVESGPDAGQVTNLNFNQMQNPGVSGGGGMNGVSMGQPQAPQQPQMQRIKVAGYGNNGIMSDLGQTDAAPVPLDYSRPAVDTPKGKGYYGKDGSVYVKDSQGGLTKILLGYDRDASYQAAKRNFDLQKAQADITQTQAATEHTQESTRASKMQNPDLGGGGAYGTQGVSGPALLQSLDPGIAAQVKAIAEGRQKPPTPIGGKISPLMTLVAQYDPTFDATDFNARYKTAQDFSSNGMSGRKVQAINQALHHAGQLSDQIDVLNNTNVMPGIINPVVNAVEKTVFGDTRQGTFQTKANALAAELRKVYAGAGGGTLEELHKWEGSFDANAGQNQQRAYLRAGMELLTGAIDSLKDSYTRGMGQHGDFSKLISPEAQANMDKVMGRSKGAPAQAIPPGAIQLLRSNPGMKADFDAKYGAGAGDRVLLGR